MTAEHEGQYQYYKASSRTPETNRRFGVGDPGPIFPSALSDGSRLSRSTAALCATVMRSAGTTA